MEPLEYPIDGVLDLHPFRPRDVKSLVSEYLAECRSRGILQVRITHGKGTGSLRRTVHAALERLPDVQSFELAGGDGGGWDETDRNRTVPRHAAVHESGASRGGSRPRCRE